MNILKRAAQAVKDDPDEQHLQTTFARALLTAPIRIRELEKAIDGVIRQVEDADRGIGNSPTWHEAWTDLKAVRRGELAVPPAPPIRRLPDVLRWYDAHRIEEREHKWDEQGKLIK